MSNLEKLLNWIPDGWPMPLGWSKLIAQIREEGKMSEDTKIKLLPCPFCGVEAFIYHQLFGSNTSFCKVSCFSDCVTMPPRHDMWFTSEDEAAKAWNRREYERTLGNSTAVLDGNE